MMTLERPALVRYVLAALLVMAALVLRPRRGSSSPQPHVHRERAARAWAEVDAGFARLDAGIALLDAKIAAALDGHIGCPSPRDARAARAKLDELRRQQAEALRRLAQLRREQATICRLPRTTVRRVIMNTACIENPLARGCM